MVELADEMLEATAPPSENGAVEPTEEWRHDKNGDAYLPRGGGRPGIIKRQGEETPADARARDAKGQKRPRPKPKKPRMPEAPRKADLKALEEELAGALKAPGAIAMSFGDEWMFEHFTIKGPYLARQLVLAADHNPWLRQKLEAMSTGEDALIKFAALFNIGGALFLYLAPPLVYLLNLPIPDRGRLMLGVPEREDKPPAPYASSAPPPPFANGTPGPVGA